jgi:hypothetical protein
VTFSWVEARVRTFTFTTDFVDNSRPTAGLVPYRHRRSKEGMRDPVKAEEWASEQPWYSRVVMRRSTPHYWCWWVTPATEAELKSIAGHP